MNIIFIIGLILLLAINGLLVWLFLRKNEGTDDKEIIEENARLKADLSQKDQNIGKLTNELKSEKSDKDQLSGKNKQLFVEITNLKSDNVNANNEKERLVKIVSNFEATEDNKRKELDEKLQKLDKTEIALDEEKKRIRREDEERLRKEKEERDRMWAEHEDSVKFQFSELCKSPQYGFQYYDNNNLPSGFGGRFKPDFLIEFLEQYVIFDAKISQSDNLQNYINGNVKSTVEKINSNPRIYSTVFFIVPNEAMKSLKKTRFYEQGYEFFVISPQSIEIVLATFKKISSYELAQQLDPRDRENIVNIIAEFDNHINMRNTLDILASESGISVLKKAETIQKDIKDEISQKKSKIRLQNFSPTEIKTLMVNTEVQVERIEKLTSPVVAIPEENVKRVRNVLGGKH